MRQRNVKSKLEIINNSKYFIDCPSKYKGNWKNIFQNDNPIYIEIGMGKGKFLIENALLNPDINYIGIEKFDSILALAIKKIPENINNLKVIRLDAINIDQVFDHEIDRLYLNFSDPWPKKRHEKRRLTSLNFLEKYDLIFRQDNIIEMKTDNKNLFAYSIKSFNNNNYKIEFITLDLKNEDIPNIMSEYEEKFTKLNNFIYKITVIKVKNKKKSIPFKKNLL